MHALPGLHTDLELLVWSPWVLGLGGWAAALPRPPGDLERLREPGVLAAGRPHQRSLLPAMVTSAWVLLPEALGESPVEFVAFIDDYFEFVHVLRFSLFWSREPLIEPHLAFRPDLFHEPLIRARRALRLERLPIIELIIRPVRRTLFIPTQIGHEHLFLVGVRQEPALVVLNVRVPARAVGAVERDLRPAILVRGLDTAVLGLRLLIFA